MVNFLSPEMIYLSRAIAKTERKVTTKGGGLAESYIQKLFSERIGGSRFGKDRRIKFEKIKRAKRETLAANPGAEIIDLGVGEPDEMAFPGAAKAALSGGRKT